VASRHRNILNTYCLVAILSSQNFIPATAHSRQPLKEIAQQHNRMSNSPPEGPASDLASLSMALTQSYSTSFEQQIMTTRTSPLELAKDPKASFFFIYLPLEIRFLIYDMIVDSLVIRVTRSNSNVDTIRSLWNTCRPIREEIKKNGRHCTRACTDTPASGSWMSIPSSLSMKMYSRYRHSSALFVSKCGSVPSRLWRLIYLMIGVESFDHC
jgi:hypothetical protein